MPTPTQQTIIDAFNMEVYDPNKLDVQNTPLYDTVNIAANAAISQTTAVFFSNVGAASSKTLAQTNLQQPTRLAAPEAFSIFGIRFRFAEDILRADALALIGNNSTTTGFAFAMVLGQKKYALGPIWYYAAGGGLYAVSTRTEESEYTNGMPTRESMHKLAIPIVIENQMTFSANLEGTSYTTTAAASGGTGVTMQTLFDGFYARGVQ